jgi:hypothetical protein
LTLLILCNAQVPAHWTDRRDRQRVGRPDY